MSVLPAVEHLTVTWQGASYPAKPVADGAAFELQGDRPGPGWHLNPEPGPRYRRFVHAGEVDRVAGPAPVPPDPPLLAPLSASVNRQAMQRLSQSAGHSLRDLALLRTVHRSAAILSGTRMVKPVSSETIPAHLAGHALIRGFCYRHHDVAHLRTPRQLAALGVAEPFPDVAFLLRWRAVSGSDYTGLWGEELAGVRDIPASHRTGPPTLGTGFVYSSDQLIPEYVTTDLEDLPLPVHAEIVACLEDGTEVVLYRYLAEHMWARVAQRRLAPVIGRIPGVDPHQDYHPIRVTPATRLVGELHGRQVEVSADPPAEFRARATSRADQQPVQTLARRTVECVTRSGVRFHVVETDAGHARVRARRPTAEIVFQYDLRCLERGVYEGWIPAPEIADLSENEVPYDLAGLRQQTRS